MSGKGGKDLRRGRGMGGGCRTEDGMSEAASSASSRSEGDGEGGMLAGMRLLAAVEGLMSWCGDGSRTRWADWMAEASSVAGLWDIFGGMGRVWVVRGLRWGFVYEGAMRALDE